jgi:hypothetical protein
MALQPTIGSQWVLYYQKEAGDLTLSLTGDLVFPTGFYIQSIILTVYTGDGAGGTLTVLNKTNQLIPATSTNAAGISLPSLSSTNDLHYRIDAVESLVVTFSQAATVADVCMIISQADARSVTAT